MLLKPRTFPGLVLTHAFDVLCGSRPKGAWIFFCAESLALL